MNLAEDIGFLKSKDVKNTGNAEVDLPQQLQATAV